MLRDTGSMLSLSAENRPSRRGRSIIRLDTNVVESTAIFQSQPLDHVLNGAHYDAGSLILITSPRGPKIGSLNGYRILVNLWRNNLFLRSRKSLQDNIC